MYSIVETLVDLARDAGVEFSFNTAVSQINTNANRASGVTPADGSRLEADVVLANADLPYVYQRLLPPGPDGEVAACESILVFGDQLPLGSGPDVRALGPHTLFLADDYRENFRAIVRDLSLPANPSLYVHAPARLDPSMAPPGQDTLTAIVPSGI